MLKKLSVLILTLIFLTPSVHAGAEEVGSKMVSSGLNVFAHSIGDNIIEIGGGNATGADSAENQTNELIFKLVTFTVDPYSFQFVKSWQNKMVVFYVAIFILACLFGGALVLLQRLSPQTMNRYLWVMAEDSSFDLRSWLGRMAVGLVFPAITAFLVYMVLQLNFAVSGILTSSIQSFVPPTLDNVVAYLFMALAYLILAVVFALRNLIITLFAAGALGIAALYLIPPLQSYVKSLIAYFVVIVFMQPALIFVAGVGVLFIQQIPLILSQFVNISYLALILLMVIMSVICILGWGIVSKIAGVAVLRRA